MTLRERVIPYFKKIEILCLAGLLFLLPFSGMTSMKEILFFLLLAAFIADKLSDHRNIDRTPLPNKSLHILIFIYFVWAVIGLIQAIDPAYSLNEIATKMSKQYLLYFLTYLIVREIAHRKVKGLLYPFIVSAIIMSIYACYQFYQFPEFFVNRVQGFTGAFYRLSTFLVLAIPVVIVLAFASHGWLKSILLFCIPILFTALFFTFTRGAWIAVIIELLILVFLFLKKYRVPFLVSTVVVFLIVVGLSYKSIISHKLITRGSEQPRIEAIKLSSEIIRKHPFVGIGYGKDTFSKYYPDIYVKHSHNIFLNTAVETGIPGLAVLIAMFGIVMKNLIRAILHETDFEKKLILSGIFASFIGFLCLNTFDYMYHGWPGQMFWMLIGIGSGLQKMEPEQTK